MPKRLYDQGLTPNQRKAAYLLGVGKTRAYAAAEVGVKEATIYTWLHNPEFRKERDKACDDYVSEVLPMAIDVFVEQAQDTREKSAWLRQNAAGRLVALMNSHKGAEDKTLNVTLQGNIGAPGVPGVPKSEAPEAPGADVAGKCAKSPPDSEVSQKSRETGEKSV